MPISERTWQQALDSQSACNLSGLAHFLVRLLDELRANGVNGTEALNTHPLVRLVVAQMAHLAYGSFDCNTGNKWQRAYQFSAEDAEANNASLNDGSRLLSAYLLKDGSRCRYFQGERSSFLDQNSDPNRRA